MKNTAIIIGPCRERGLGDLTPQIAQ